MDPRSRVAAAALASTIAAMYFAAQELAPLIRAASLPERVGAGVLAVLASGTLYQAINGAATWVILKISRLKRLFFGAHYLEDTWAGFYEGAER
jgi:H+/gluconate symporter-like permease